MTRAFGRQFKFWSRLSNIKRKSSIANLGPTKKQRHVLVGLVHVLTVIAASLLGGSPIIRTRFLGDELEVWNAFKSGKYPTSFQSSLTFAGIDKWRPLNSLAMQAILRSFKDVYSNYWLFSWVLLLVLGAVMYCAHQKLFHIDNYRHSSASWIGVVIVVSSPFTFAARSGIHGFLEITPIILCVISYVAFDSSAKSLTKLPIVYSALLALCAGLIHERYFAFSVAMALVAISRSRKHRHVRGMWLIFLGNGIFYIYSSAVILKLNVLKGGGADALNEVNGFWIIPHVFHALIHLFGGSGAETTYFDTAKPTNLYQDLTLVEEHNLLFPVSILCICIGAVFFKALAWKRRTPTSNEARAGASERNTTRTLVEITGISIALLVPAATINSRIEARWLFGSLVFLVILLSGLASSDSHASRYLARGILVILFVANVLGRWSYAEFDWWRTRSERVLTTVEQLAPKAGTWELAIIVPNYPDENNSAVWWGLNYGGALINYLDNAPNGIYFGERDVVSSCNRPCLVLTVQDDRRKREEIDSADNQIIVYRWLK